ncbi:fucose isomerase [candidate division KSB3 bacterium]|uniref:Fucose isomerase n=1 Tax=candidate division KSB3 bacterium TaxID=2044937 RepID=A0A9D5JVX2_9BACT|nr:fucose isomerase [candidate division KSB3 bacterium]MBD3325223.1 fucose isomerase [candidate division KSB3 bacterium]
MTTFGLIVGNRGFFPSKLCEEGRQRMLKVLEAEGFQVVTLALEDTPYGTVETYDQAKKCAELFQQHAEEIDGIIVTLPNFGDERGVADTIRLAGLNVPMLVHAFSDEPDKLDAAHRRDSFCGKMSACNNLYQYGIPYTLTTRHTVNPEQESFKQDVQKFGAVCRVVNGLCGARFGQVGARPAAFITVRYSEKVLERSGISVESLDLSDLFGRIGRLADDDPAVVSKLEEIKGYIVTQGIPEISLLRMAKFGVEMDRFIAEHELDGTAVQCWSAMEEFFGTVPCTVMSMLSNSLKPSACETDITGLIGMYAMRLASEQPSALLDWNNNWGDDPDKGIVFHCSNLPQEFFGGKAVMGNQDILAGAVGKENSYGTVTGQIRPMNITFCRVSTDDYQGNVRVYLGEGEITEEQVESFGGCGVVKVPNFQKLLQHICKHGYEHHVALNPSQVAEALHEAFTTYLGWDVYYHHE